MPDERRGGDGLVPEEERFTGVLCGEGIRTCHARSVPEEIVQQRWAGYGCHNYSHLSAGTLHGRCRSLSPFMRLHVRL